MYSWQELAIARLASLQVVCIFSKSSPYRMRDISSRIYLCAA